MRSGAQIARAFHFSREGLAQRLVSALVLGHEPVGWNYRGAPTWLGRVYLDRLDELAFGRRHDGDPLFVDELELLKRAGVDPKDASPDQAVLWDDRLLIIEMKTEKASHQPGQCEWYLDLGVHRHPGRRVDLIYLTGPMPPWRATYCPPGSTTTHVTWDAVDGLVQDVWADGTPQERDLAITLHRVVSRLTTPWAAAKREWLSGPEEEAAEENATAPAEIAVDALEVALAVADDHLQRAIETHATDLEELGELRNRIAEQIDARSIGDGHVRPWVWRVASKGRPLTAMGRETGYEIRLSWYAKEAS